MRSLPTSFILPDLKKACPLKDSTNPHYLEAAGESRAWIDEFNIFVDRKRAFFIQGCNELLVSHTYPYANFEEFRTCCDFVNLLFVVDETSDDQNAKDVQATGEIFLNAMLDETWNNASVLCTITKDFRARFVRTATKSTQRRFFTHCQNYIAGVSREAELREQGRVLPLASFTPLRRENSAVRVCFGLFEFALGIELPEAVFEDEGFMRMYFAATDMVCWANDLYSWNMEQAKCIGGNNVLTVLMHERNIDLQSAADVVGTHFTRLMRTFLEEKGRLRSRSWGRSVDEDVAKYVGAMEKWIGGNLVWSFETPRYFGRDHLRVERTLEVVVRSRGNPEDA